MSNRLMTTIAAAAMSVASFGTASSAATFDLAFIMDRSGSVADSDFTSAMNSLANALDASLANNPSDTYNVKVITFATSASNVVDTSIAPNTSEADIETALTNAIRTAGTAATSGSTCYSCAFALLGTSSGDAGIINMMTDGVPTAGDTSLAGLQSDTADLRTAGWDSLSFEAVEQFGDAPDSAFLAELAFDTTGTGTQPIITDPADITNPLTNAFVLEVSGFGTAYDAAISAKVQKIVTPDPIPLPAGLPLILLGLGALGALRMRGRKAA